MAVNNNHQEAITRGQVKKERKHEERASVRVRVRLIPIWLRMIIVIALLALSIVAGAAFGYSVMGNGKAGDIFDKSTWTHMVELINKQAEGRG